MENNINIEDLFRSKLQGMEANPPANGWEAIQSKMSAQATTASTGAAAAKGGLGLAKIAAITTIAVGTGLGVGYFVFKGDDKKAETTNTREQTTNNATVNVNDNTVELPNNVQVTEINSVHKQGKVLSIVEIKKGNETQKVLVEVNQTEKQKSPSIVGHWLSTDKTKNKYSQDLINKLLEQMDSDKETVSTEITPSSNKTEEVKVQKLENDEVIAGIGYNVGEGYAPLTVDFSNLTPADSYEWNFNGLGTSNEASPRFTFNEPGNYFITVTVKNKSGKAKSASTLITVTEKPVETVSGEESAIIIPKGKGILFSPNGDGIADVFLIPGKNIETFHMTIVDQRGNIMFESNDIDNGWDGFFNGDKAPIGNYFCIYKATGKDRVVYKDKIMFRLNR